MPWYGSRRLVAVRLIKQSPSQGLDANPGPSDSGPDARVTKPMLLWQPTLSSS